MFKLFSIFILMTLMISLTFAQISDINYRIYDAQGNPATIDRIVDAARKSDVVFLGENHDDAVAHYLQLEIFKRTLENYAKSKKIALSMEMFERDVQIVLDEYLKDLITEKKFLDDSRPWKNYKTDYRPLVELAKQNRLVVIAANAPRRYVNIVSRNGRDSLNQLSPEAKKWLAPLPYASASADYSKKFTDLMGGMSGDNHSLTKILDSQTLWDATMAYSIAEYLKNNKNALVIHLNGTFHTENRLGTVEQLLKFNPKAKVLVITMKSDDNFTEFDKLKDKNLGDFIILTDAKLPRSFKGGN
ncbi:MAG: ChaN family lipoprotein [Acidobacteria bacterium]|nr:ChaN family lipoprotein [Acidobacteriota bacterium]